MRKKSRNLKSFLVLIALLAGVVGANFVFASGHNQHTSQAHITGGPKAATARVVSMHVVNMQHVPAERPKSLSHRLTALPFLTGESGTVYAQRKAVATHNTHALRGSHANSRPTA